MERIAWCWKSSPLISGRLWERRRKPVRRYGFDLDHVWRGPSDLARRCRRIRKYHPEKPKLDLKHGHSGCLWLSRLASRSVELAHRFRKSCGASSRSHITRGCFKAYLVGLKGRAASQSPLKFCSQTFWLKRICHIETELFSNYLGQ